MKRIYKVEVESGNTKWFNEVGQFHRIEGPAIEWADGSKEWFLNGKRHREGGPAIEGADGRKVWYLNGVVVTPEEVLEQAIAMCDEKAIENMLWDLG